MKARYRGLELQSWSNVYPILEAVSGWFDQKNGPADLLHRLRQAGFCFCETVYGCFACKGGHNMSRNQFENNYDPDDDIVIVRVSETPVFILPKPEDGLAYEMVERETGEFAIYVAMKQTRPDPADRYRSMPISE